MTAQDAAAWFDARLSDPAEAPVGTPTAAAYSLAREALRRWEELLDIESDYAAVAKKSAELQARFEAVRPPEPNGDLVLCCPRCRSFVKRTYYYCPNCAQRLRKETYKIRN